MPHDTPLHTPAAAEIAWMAEGNPRLSFTLTLLRITRDAAQGTPLPAGMCRAPVAPACAACAHEARS